MEQHTDTVINECNQKDIPKDHATANPGEILEQLIENSSNQIDATDEIINESIPASIKHDNPSDHDTQKTDTSQDPLVQRASVLETFNNTVIELIEELKDTFPELRESLIERYQDLRSDDSSVLEWFETHAQSHFMDITTKNDELFKKHDTTFLLPDINFSHLWKCKLTKKTKVAIWKYLHVLLLLVSHYQLSTQDFEATFSQWNQMLDESSVDEDELKKMRSQAEHIMKLMENLASQKDDDEEEEDGDDNKEERTHEDDKTGFTEEDLKQDPFIQQLENSKIAKFAKELSKEIDVSSLGFSPEAGAQSFQDVLGSIGKNPQRLLGLVKKVGDKIQTKLNAGDINQSELVSEAHDLVKTMQDSKAFKRMFKKAKKRGKGGVDPHTLFNTMMKNMAQTKGGPFEGQHQPEMNPDAMQAMISQMMGGMAGMGNPLQNANEAATRDRLRQKLANRDNEQVTQKQEDALTDNIKQMEGTNKKRRKKKKKKKSNSGSVE